MANRKKFSKDMKLSDVPVDCFSKIIVGNAEFASDDGGEKNNLRLTLYDGKVHYHWWWGNMAFDLKGMSMLKKSGNPILYSHNRDEPIGVSDEASFDGKFVMVGRFLSAPLKAAEIKSNVADGLKYEASLNVDSIGAVVEHIEEGMTGECNGLKVKGPGTIFRKSVISEGSVCLFGALDKCKTDIFDKSKIEGTEEMKMSEFKKDHAKLHDEVFAEGVAKGIIEGEKKKKDQFTKVLELCDGDHELATKSFSEDLSEVDCLQAKNKKLASENASLLKLSKTETPANPKKKVDPARQQFIDDSKQAIKDGKGKDGGDDDTDSFMDKVEAFAKEHKCNMAKAVNECATLYPELQEKMRSA